MSTTVDWRGTRVLVLGAGGHGRVVAEAARAVGAEIVGYADADPAKAGIAVDGLGGAVVTSQDRVLSLVGEGAPLPEGADRLLLGIGDNHARAALLDRLMDAAPTLLPPLIHPRAFVSESSRLGAAVVVLPTAVVHTAAVVEDGAIVNTAALVEHDCVVGAASHVAVGALLCGGVRVGARTLIGAGAVLRPLVAVGDDAVVGAGSVVVRDVPSRSVVAGVPARPLARSLGSCR